MRHRTHKIYNLLRHMILGFIAEIITRLGLLHLLLLITDRWKIKIKEDSHLIFPVVEKRKHYQFQILLYHRVNNDNDPFFGGIPIKVFARQMEVLREYFNVLPLEELVERTLKKDIPPKAIAITFDDGYKDNYENAYPILNRFGLPTTIFLAVGSIGGKESLWHDRVFLSFKKTARPFIEWKKNGKLIRYPLRTLREKVIAKDEIIRSLRLIDDRERIETVDSVVEKLGAAELNKEGEAMLGWNEIKVMQNNGISFGSHTVTHPVLSKVSKEKAIFEIYESKRIIEDNLRVPVKFFAYPFGAPEDFDKYIKLLIKRAGYKCALTTAFGLNSFDQDLFELRRGTPWEKESSIFATKLCTYRLIAS